MPSFHNWTKITNFCHITKFKLFFSLLVTYMVLGKKSYEALLSRQKSPDSQMKIAPEMQIEISSLTANIQKHLLVNYLLVMVLDGA